MLSSRGSVLAGLVFVAIAAPVAAYAVSADDPDPAPSSSSHGHPGTSHKPAKADDSDDSEDSDGQSTGTEHPAEASGPGRAHAEAMKAWAHCVADAASGPKVEGSPIPPKEACGDKPVAPGRAKHADDKSKPGKSGEPHGQSGSHRH